MLFLDHRHVDWIDHRALPLQKGIATSANFTTDPVRSSTSTAHEHIFGRHRWIYMMGDVLLIEVLYIFEEVIFVPWSFDNVEECIEVMLFVWIKGKLPSSMLLNFKYSKMQRFILQIHKFLSLKWFIGKFKENPYNQLRRDLKSWIKVA